LGEQQDWQHGDRQRERGHKKPHLTHMFSPSGWFQFDSQLSPKHFRHILPKLLLSVKLHGR
jgi:hypothetical protein